MTVISIHHRFDREIDRALAIVNDAPTSMIHIPLTPPLGLPVIGEPTWDELVAQGGDHRPLRVTRRGRLAIAALILLAVPFGYYGGQLIASVIREHVPAAPTVPGPAETYKASLTIQQNFDCEWTGQIGPCDPR